MDKKKLIKGWMAGGHREKQSIINGKELWKHICFWAHGMDRKADKVGKTVDSTQKQRLNFDSHSPKGWTKWWD